jgi:RHS repeat-associated protein
VYLDTLYQTADAAGNVIRSGDLHLSACDGHAHDAQTATNSYYSADNRLMAVQRWTDGSRTWEEYWYDALGRRVLVRTRHDQPSCVQQPSQACPGFVERTVWDGDQMIGEQRTSGLDGITGGAPYFGTVRYVHLVGMDAPVAILDSRFSDARVIHYNWRGLAEASSFTDGSAADCELGGGSCTRIAWNAGEGVYFKRALDPYAGMTPTWIGSLPANGKGDAGLLYRRNRFFDPASGRFTQEDPIGVGGGLNLYGFAAGDPINFSDAFGLCPRHLSMFNSFLCHSIEATGTGAGFLLGFVTGAGTGALETVASGGALAPVAIAQTVAMSTAGAAAGLASARLLTNHLFSDEGSGSSSGGDGGPAAKRTSLNQMNQQIRRGQAPRGINRVDRAKVPGEQDNVHFEDGSALNRDGSWKHGSTTLTNAQQDWLLRGGWRLPR